jgi:hypothetical protein
MSGCQVLGSSTGNDFSDDWRLRTRNLQNGPGEFKDGQFAVAARYG